MSYERITAVLDCYHVDLSPSERLVLVVLAHYENSRTGRCNPSQAAISTRVNLSERHVNRLLQGLRERGLIAFVDGRGGRNVSNHYTITIPANPDISDTLSSEETLTPVSGLQNKTLTSTAETLTWVHKNPDMGVLRIRKNKEEQGIAIGGVGDEEASEDLGAPLARRKLTLSAIQDFRERYFDIEVDAELEKFRNHPRKAQPRDQVRAFENWLKNARRFAAERANGRQNRSQRPDFSTEEDRRVLAELSR